MIEANPVSANPQCIPAGPQCIPAGPQCIPAGPQWRRTKIVATVGPASQSLETLKELLMAGVNVFRLNFSHGSYDEHFKTLGLIRQAARETGLVAGVLQDLSGPKIRISPVDADKALISDGGKVTLRYATGTHVSDRDTLYVEALDPAQIMKTGERVLLSDGTMELIVDAVSSDSVTCSVIKGGTLRSRVGIAFPDSEYQVAAATSKDFKDLAWGIEHGVDFIAESFVSDLEDIVSLRMAMRQKGVNIPIIAKIERRKALDNLDDIVRVADGIMVARGDLGVELPLEQVPMIQKELIERANRAGIPVIVATQMLASMVTAIRPTRAEVSDVATAVLSGADAVMLSEETAIGAHPAECVRYLSRIACEAEKRFDFEDFQERVRVPETETVADAVAYAARAASYKLNASAIVSGTESGRTVRLVARYRPQQPIFGASYREETCRRMSLYWGVEPILVPAADTITQEIGFAVAEIRKRGMLPEGSTIVATAGQTTRTTGTTSMMTVLEL